LQTGGITTGTDHKKLPSMRRSTSRRMERKRSLPGKRVEKREKKRSASFKPGDSFCRLIGISASGSIFFTSSPPKALLFL
jgi:hypothetical protein